MSQEDLVVNSDKVDELERTMRESDGKSFILQ